MGDSKPTINEVEHFLTPRYGEVREVAPLRGGEWSKAYGLVADGQDLVVRFGQYIEDYEKDRVASSWSGPSLPIPEVVEIGNAFDASFAVSRRLFGDKLDELPA